jgi:spermidine/putrescine-binding protein
MSDRPVSTHSRAEFLRRAGAAALVVSGAEAVGAGVAHASRFVPHEVARSAATTLKFVGWQGYDGTPSSTFPVLQQWEDSKGINLSSTYIDVNEDIITKTQASPSGSYDLASPYHGTVKTLILAGLVEPIRVGRMQNWSSIIASLRRQGYLHDKSGQVFAVPLGFSADLPLYNPKLIKPPKTWAEIFAKKYRRRYAVKDGPEGNMVAVAKAYKLGHPDAHHLTRSELKRVEAGTRTLLKGARANASSYGDLLQLLVTKEVAFATTGTADMIPKAASQGVQLRAWFPKEGTQSYVDNYCIPRGSQNYDLALAWIDEMISPQVNAELAAVYGGGVVTPQAVRYLTPDLRAKYPYNNIQTFFTGNAPLLPPIPVSSRIFATYADWVQAYNRAKSG